MKSTYTGRTDKPPSLDLSKQQTMPGIPDVALHEYSAKEHH